MSAQLGQATAIDPNGEMVPQEHVGKKSGPGSQILTTCRWQELSDVLVFGGLFWSPLRQPILDSLCKLTFLTGISETCFNVMRSRPTFSSPERLDVHREWCLRRNN